MEKMDARINELVKKAWAKYEQTPSNRRLLIAVSGIPGSGKTTVAITISNRLNALSPASPPCANVPMDGFHLTRAKLSLLDNPDEAHRRRGAAFTFNSSAYLDLVRRLYAPLTAQTPTIYAPSFSHQTKDPVENDIAILPSHRIIIFEGNYLSLDRGEWKVAAELMNMQWFVEVDEAVAKGRLVARHLKTGVETTREAAETRVDGSDLVNGRDVVAHRGRVDEMIESVEVEDVPKLVAEAT